MGELHNALLVEENKTPGEANQKFCQNCLNVLEASGGDAVEKWNRRLATSAALNRQCGRSRGTRNQLFAL